MSPEQNSAMHAMWHAIKFEYRYFSLDELRWDWCCAISGETRQLIREELARRHVAIVDFDKLGRGTRRDLMKRD